MKTFMNREWSRICANGYPDETNMVKYCPFGLLFSLFPSYSRKFAPIRGHNYSVSSPTNDPFPGQPVGSRLRAQAPGGWPVCCLNQRVK